jgi:magnesium transporter
VNNRLSAVMARMALAATIFLPLTFVTGFFGMNLPGTTDPVGWWVVGVFVLALPSTMWIWFRKRGWF